MRFTALVLVVGALQGMPSVALAAPIWQEAGDAGRRPDDAQAPAGTGALSTIAGALPFGDIDMYQIRGTGSGSCSASAGGMSPLFLDPGLFLFDATGQGVYANADAFFPDPFSGPGRALLPAGDPLTPAASAVYFLAISAYDQLPVSPGGRIFPFSPDGTRRLRTNRLWRWIICEWLGWSPFDAGSYTISVAGAEFASHGRPGADDTLLAGFGVGWRRWEGAGDRLARLAARYRFAAAASLSSSRAPARIPSMA